MLVPSGFFCSLLSFTLHETKVGLYSCERPASQELRLNLDEKKNSRAERTCLKAAQGGKVTKKIIVFIHAFNKHVLNKAQRFLPGTL